MFTIFTVLVYFFILLLLQESKLKTQWIIWVAFFSGFSIAYYKETIMQFLISTL